MITLEAASFAAALPAGGRLAGLDIGTRTIGVALCDAQWLIASPAQTIARRKFNTDAAALLALADRQQVRGFVAGLPLNLDGSHSPQTQAVRSFCRNLEPLLSGRPILLWDERWSTMAVERAMIAADLSRAKRESRIDKAAAAYILQGALDALVRLAPTQPR